MGRVITLGLVAVAIGATASAGELERHATASGIVSTCPRVNNSLPPSPANPSAFKRRCSVRSPSGTSANRSRRV